MKLVAISKRASLILLAWCVFIFGTGTDDFINGEKAFNKNEYRLAEIYFSHLLADEPYDEHVPDAVYYLAKIHGAQGNFIDMVTQANRFLEDFKYDVRGREIFNLVLTQLDRAKAYSLALEYIKRYDYLIDDLQILERIGNGLFEQNRLTLADYIFSLCSQTDTIKIIRAQLNKDTGEKKEIYESIKSAKGKIYLTEFQLETGDTIAAFQAYNGIDHEILQAALLYRYAKLSRFFDRPILLQITERLSMTPTFEDKASLLSGKINDVGLFVPTDQEEFALLLEYLAHDTVISTLPDTVNIDSIIPDSLTEENIQLLRTTLGRYFYLDSLYCELLVTDNRVDEAFQIIELYMAYQNTRDYARKIRALKLYSGGKYRSAAVDLILANVKHPGYRLLLANSLTKLGEDAIAMYENLLKTDLDTVFISRVVTELVRVYFRTAQYENVVQLEPKMFENDTSLIRMYVYSLVHAGQKEKADSLLAQYFLEPDYYYFNRYGEYLIEQKKYTQAAAYYDSLIGLSDIRLPGIVYYNRAVIPFLKGQADTALYKFQLFADELRKSDEYPRAMFKVATIKYLNREFDSAAYYYSLASKDDTLRLDALQNQLICYKKTGNWSMVVKTGRKILPMTSGNEEVEVQFEIGYGFLRSGRTREAVDYLTNAAKLKPSPAFYYWLAEAYVAKGDFSRALYQYLRIVDLFPADEMWTPTAEYKIGIAFELMDELEEAKKVYNGIIRRRGPHDTWGIEAQKRLDILD